MYSSRVEWFLRKKCYTFYVVPNGCWSSISKFHVYMLPLTWVAVKIFVYVISWKFTKILILCFTTFSSNLAKFSKTLNTNLGEIFTILRNTKPKYGEHFCYFKGAVSRDFGPLFFSWIEPIWASDKLAKMVFLKNLFLWRYSNLKFENLTPHRLTLRGVETFWQASPLKI